MEKKKPLYLPSELVTEILVRLPVKSLVCFKCVCKSWFSLISNSNFANSHFHLTATNTSRILSISSLSPKIQSIDFESLFNSEYTSLTLNLPSSFPPEIEIKGSCRGFLFLLHYSKLYLWNPSTGFHRQIPTSPFHSKLNDKAYRFPRSYGFGYDQSRDDYLLVLFCSKIENDLLSYLEFFSLRDNTWKEIEDTHFTHINPCYNPEPGTLFKGAIHWLGFSLDLTGNIIVVFDLMERKLLEVNLPDDLEHCRACNLWVFGEFLSICTWSDVNATLEIWVMKEHLSWTKTLVLVINDVGIPYFLPICSTKSGDIIGTNYGYGLVRCNKGKIPKYRSFDNNRHRFKVVVYTESLLSLPCDCEQI